MSPEHYKFMSYPLFKYDFEKSAVFSFGAIFLEARLLYVEEIVLAFDC